MLDCMDSDVTLWTFIFKIQWMILFARRRSSVFKLYKQIAALAFAPICNHAINFPALHPLGKIKINNANAANPRTKTIPSNINNPNPCVRGIIDGWSKKS